MFYTFFFFLHLKKERRKRKTNLKNYIGKILDSSTFNKVKLTAIIQIPLWSDFRSEQKALTLQSYTDWNAKTKQKPKGKAVVMLWHSSACSGRGHGAALGAMLTHPALDTQGSWLLNNIMHRWAHGEKWLGESEEDIRQRIIYWAASKGGGGKKSLESTVRRQSARPLGKCCGSHFSGRRWHLKYLDYLQIIHSFSTLIICLTCGDPIGFVLVKQCFYWTHLTNLPTFRREDNTWLPVSALQVSTVIICRSFPYTYHNDKCWSFPGI